MNDVSNDGSVQFRLSKLLSGMSGSHLSICTCKDDGHETNYFRKKLDIVVEILREGLIAW